MSTDFPSENRLAHSLPVTGEFLGGVCEKTVRNLINRGELRAVKIGRRTMIRDEDLRIFLKTRPIVAPAGEGVDA